MRKVLLMIALTLAINANNCDRQMIVLEDNTATALFYAELYLEYTGSGVSSYSDLSRVLSSMKTAIKAGHYLKANCKGYDLTSSRAQLNEIKRALDL